LLQIFSARLSDRRALGLADLNFYDRLVCAGRVDDVDQCDCSAGRARGRSARRALIGWAESSKAHALMRAADRLSIVACANLLNVSFIFDSDRFATS
jgi:hypothetical protein